MSLLRTCPPATALALQDGGIELWKGDLFTFTSFDESTTYYWTSWSSNLTIDGITYISQSPWIKRTKWNLVNTMEVPACTVTLMALDTSFNGGANVKLQVHNGLFDGAGFVLSRVYMPTPGDVVTLGGAFDLMGGVVGNATVDGSTATLDCKGKNDLLQQYAPRNIYQIGCLHAFCDPGCTLNRASFTASYTVGATGLTDQFIPWPGTAPTNYATYAAGTLKMISGQAAGQTRTIMAADADGLTLVYPLYETPAVGDSFTAFQGCDKTKDSGSQQSCTAYNNTQNYRGFPYVPPPNAAY